MCSTFNIYINKEQNTVNIFLSPEEVVLSRGQPWRWRSSRTERPGRLVLAGHFGLDALAVVVVNHLVGHFCEHALSQSSWRCLRRRRGKHQSYCSYKTSKLKVFILNITASFLTNHYCSLAFYSQFTLNHLHFTFPLNIFKIIHQLLD